MNCKVGDKVRFLNDIGGGTVTRVINAKMVSVEDSDGFEIPVMMSDIVVVEAHAAKPAAEPPRPTPQATKRAALQEVGEPSAAPEEDGDEYEILLAFVPVDENKPTECDAELHIINDSPYRALFTVAQWTSGGQVRLLGSGDLEPDSKEPLCLLPLADLHRIQTLNVSFILYKRRDFTPQVPGQVNIEMNPLKFVKQNSFKENDFFEEKAYIYKVVSSTPQTEQLVIDPKELKKAMFQKNKNEEGKSVRKPSVDASFEEVDLHIDYLVDNAEGMSSGEILEIQKARFTTALDLAIEAGTPRMVFIHGIGNGKLKHEIRKLLDSKYSGKVRYQDASFEEYGYGATMVML